MKIVNILLWALVFTWLSGCSIGLEIDSDSKHKKSDVSTRDNSNSHTLSFDCVEGIAWTHRHTEPWVIFTNENGAPYQCADFCRNYPNRCRRLDNVTVSRFKDLPN